LRPCREILVGLASTLILGVDDLPRGILVGCVQTYALAGLCVNTTETSITDAMAS
jgi:hypothetical protein